MDLRERCQRLVKYECHVVNKHVDELHEEVGVHSSFLCKVLPVEGVLPYTLDDLEDLVPNVELVEELRMRSCTLGLDVELHERMQ